MPFSLKLVPSRKQFLKWKPKVELSPRAQRVQSVKGKRWRFMVWYPARSITHPATQPPPSWSQDLFIHMPCQLPGERTALLPSRRWKLFKHTEAFTVLYQVSTYSWVESARVGKVPCLGAQRLSTIQPSRRLNPRSLASKLRRLPLSHDSPHCKPTEHAVLESSPIME